MDLRQIIEQYHLAADKFSRGDPAPIKKLFSHGDDVLLANPFGPAVKGWKKVSDALDFASSRMRDGEVTSFETISEYKTSELAVIHEIERWKAKVSDRDKVESFDLRVTSTFRLDDGRWNIVSRHADPIAAFRPYGPLQDGIGAE